MSNQKLALSLSLPRLAILILLSNQLLFTSSWTGPTSRRLKSSALYSTTRRPGSGSGKGSKWKRRRAKRKPGYQPAANVPMVRPILADYKTNRNSETNRNRLVGEISCEHFASCSGCAVNENVGKIDVVKTAKRYFSSTSVRRHRIDIQSNGKDPVVETDDDGFYQLVIPSEIHHWRTQAKLVVAPRSSSWAKDGCIFGLYKKGSHEVVEIPACRVHHPSINRAIAALERSTRRVSTAAYSKESQEGGLRYIQAQVERITGRICLTLVWASQDLKGAQPGLSRLTKELNSLEPDLWHSMWCHCNDSPGNNIFSRNSRSWYKLSGMEFLREPLAVGNVGWLYFTPFVFRQGNLDGFDIIANDVARAVSGGSKVCEMYAGVGLLGLTSLVHHSRPGGTPLTWVRCSDENPANLRCFSRSVDSLPSSVSEYKKNPRTDVTQLTLGDLRRRMEDGIQLDEIEREGSKISYSVEKAANALRSGQALGANVIIVDPPRKGLEAEVLEELCKPINPKQDYVESSNLLSVPDELVNWTNDANTLIYVSCGFDALARDSEVLLSSRGGWSLQSATGYVLFPGSNHVETLCIFRR